MKFWFNEKEASISNKNLFLFETEASFSLKKISFQTIPFLKYAITMAKCHFRKSIIRITIVRLNLKFINYNINKI